MKVESWSDDTYTSCCWSVFVYTRVCRSLYDWLPPPVLCCHASQTWNSLLVTVPPLLPVLWSTWRYFWILFESRHGFIVLTLVTEQIKTAQSLWMIQLQTKHTQQILAFRVFFFLLLKNVEKHTDKAFRDLRCKAARNTLRGVTVKGFLGQNLHETQYDI